MDIAEARGASKCVEKMEKEVAPQKRQYYRTTVLNIISSLCSVASVAFCILLSINAADIKNRVVDLESGNGEHTFLRVPGYSMDDFNSLIEQRVDELLSQARRNPSKHLKSSCVHMNENAILFTFQRSYENFVKIRTARQASPECNCPPGRTCDTVQSSLVVGSLDGQSRCWEASVLQGGRVLGNDAEFLLKPGTVLLLSLTLCSLCQTRTFIVTSAIIRHR
ncbi:Collagen alpha-1(XXV) chain CLAC-P [Collichthys lucidus]|uniref:Collagen alpha-1(XXV) chain CLAC-P n=1 Tax=Collichthys lucidus TaxID=240159 RepID=A0A4U5VVH8_COLLU|nr:Collagen alpha-1(XXV) chain CLAC-P [Collichthys lucidus]